MQDTIQAIYPKYYPQDIVAFFSKLHSKESIIADIEKGYVRVLFLDNCLIGTGTLLNNHITRLFVLPNFQNHGYGSYMMQQMEEDIAAKYDLAILDASLCATCFYEHKGYQTVSHNELPIENGFSLVYGIMAKPLTESSTRTRSVDSKECKGENSMEKLMYMMMIEKSKTYNKMTKQVVLEHVENIRRLDDKGKLEICGVFKGYPGMAGMYILKTENREEAEAICKAEPLVVGGYATYKLVDLQIANRENNYLL